MKNFVRLLISLIVLLSWMFTAEAVAPSRVSDSDREAIEILSRAIAAPPDRTDEILNQLRFGNAIAVDGFKNWPSLRKIEAAYLSAVQGGGLPEGQKFLGRFASIIAADHSNAVRYEPALQAHFSAVGTTGADPIRFAPLPASPPPPNNRAVREAIRTLSKYMGRVPGGTPSAMFACCGVHSDKAYEILRTANTTYEAMERAINEGELPPALRERLLRFLRTVDENSDSVRYEPALAGYAGDLDRELRQPSGSLRSAPPTVNTDVLHVSDKDEAHIRALIASAAKSESLSDQAVAQLADPSVRGEPTSVTKNEDSYRSLLDSIELPSDESPFPGDVGGGGELSDREHSSSRPKPLPNAVAVGPQPRFSFRAMRVGGRGFGGVVFGNSLDYPKAGKPTGFFWVSDSKADDRGHFDIVIDSKSVVSTRSFHGADAYAAWEIVTGRPNVFAALDVKAGEGVGIASVLRGGRGEMVVHPALYGLEVGDAAAMADAIGFKMSPEYLLNRLEAVGAPAVVLTKARQWRSASNGFYKIIDAPLSISIQCKSGQCLSVRTVRKPEKGISEASRRVAFLDFQKFGCGELFEDKPCADSEALPFRQIVPSLIAGFNAFERLNSFAEIFAMMRWAKVTGAEIKPPQVPTRGTAMLYISALGDGSLVQSTTDLSRGIREAQYLAHMREQTEQVKATFQKAGTPTLAMQCISNVADAALESVYVELAQGRLGNSTLEDATVTVGRKLDEALDARIKDLGACPTRTGLLKLVISDVDRAEVSRLEVAAEAARSAYWNVEGDEESYEERVSRLPAARRAEGERLLKEMKSASMATVRIDDFANLGTTSKKYKAAEQKLLKLLPKTQLAIAEASLKKADKALELAIQRLSPKWLSENWSSVEQLRKTPFFLDGLPGGR